MQTALHIQALTRQLKTEIVGGKLVATEFYKKQRAAFFFVKIRRSTVALGFVYHPAGSGGFCVPASKIRLDTNEKPWPIFGLDGAEITDVTQDRLDRFLELRVTQNDQEKRVVFELLGPNGNLWLLDDQGGRQATLRNRKYKPGDLYEPAPLGERVSPLDLTAEDLSDWLGENLERSPLAELKRRLSGFNETMIREAVRRAEMTLADLRHPEEDRAARLAVSMRHLAERFGSDTVGYLYEIAGGVEVYPFKLASRDEQPEKFKTLSLAVWEMVNRRRSNVSEASEEKSVLKAVGRAVKRKRKLAANLEADIAKAADYERYKRFGELLQLNRDRLKKGMKTIEVEDILSRPAVTVTIKLDPAAAPNDNIETYFRRHRKGREGLELLQRREEITRGDLESLTKMQDDLEADFDAARQRYDTELLSLLPAELEKREILPRLPYRPATLSTGLTIFIGRDGADNDRTTFEFGRPYELWFHAQQCPGSHVVMKFPSKSFVPSMREIEETAAIAAFHSKAKNDTLVPVIYAPRKYVRKPRKAKPGLVTVEREKSVMVAPTKEAKPR